MTEDVFGQTGPCNQAEDRYVCKYLQKLYMHVHASDNKSRKQHGCFQKE